jgi:hypothetical protein
MTVHSGYFPAKDIVLTLFWPTNFYMLCAAAGASEAAFNRVRDAVRIPMYGKLWVVSSGV